jgi:hypothetical protein
MDIFEAPIQQAIEFDNRIKSAARIQLFDHQISVCNQWLEEKRFVEMSHELGQLVIEMNVIDEIAGTLESGSAVLASSHLTRLNGEAGEYNDVSGSMLGICTNWAAKGLLTQFPDFRHEPDADETIDVGISSTINDDKTISVKIVTPRVEEIPDEQKTNAFNFKYSGNSFSIVELNFVSLESLEKRRTEAQSEYDTVSSSSLNTLRQNIREKLFQIQEQRKALADEIYQALEKISKFK